MNIKGNIWIMNTAIPKRAALCMALALTGWVATAVADAPPNSAETLDPAQAEWLQASPEQRRTIGERIGEEGGRDLARQMRLKPIFDGSEGKAVAQGPDQVYVSKEGRVHVFECKANSAPLNHSYGYQQGTVEHTVESSKRILKSAKASALQREAARRVIEAAGEGTLDVSVVRTAHQLGKPVATTLESTCSTVARMAPKAVAHLAPETVHPAPLQPHAAPAPKLPKPATAWTKPLQQAGRLLRYVF